MNLPRVLIVEDNWEVRELLHVILSGKGFDVMEVETGQAAIDFCEDHPPDVVVLDLTLPDLDGLEVCKKVKTFPQMDGVPIIMCTARTDVEQKIIGLETGADDYLTKPFDPAELVARIKVLLRRSGQSVSETRKIVQSGDLKLDPRNYQATLGGKKVEYITPREFDILYFLLEKSPQPLSRTEISKFILGKNLSEDSRVIDMHVAQIRKKLGSQISSHIRTIPGKGYLWSK